MTGKVRIRLQAKSKKDLERVRKKILQDHSQVIFSYIREVVYTSSGEIKGYACFGDYTIGKVRRRRNEV